MSKANQPLNQKSDRILPGQASASLIEVTTFPLVNEVRISENRANKASSVIGNGLFGESNIRQLSDEKKSMGKKNESQSIYSLRKLSNKDD